MALFVTAAIGLSPSAAASSPPSITSFVPTSGTVGTKVTINGSGFSGASAVTFNTISAKFKVISDSQVTTTVPSKALTGPIAIKTSGGTGTSSTPFGVIPTVSSFSPTSGHVGTGVTIQGKAFTGATAVTFNGTAAVFKVNSYWKINATVPAGATTGPVGVTTPGGSGASATSFTVPASPTISGFDPTSGAVGTPVKITGTGFTGTTGVTFAGTAATFSVSSDSLINTTVPTGATTGPIQVATPNGTVGSTANFMVSASQPPAITGFSPTTGPPGTGLDIIGTGFSGATTVTFNGTPANFAVDSDTQLTAAVPAGATDGPIQVTTPGGQGTSQGSFAVLAGSTSPIQHVVIIDQENHSFNDVLGAFCVEQQQGSIVRAGLNQGCVGTTQGQLYGGASYQLTAEANAGLTIGHGVLQIRGSIDGGKMDGFSNLPGCTASDSPAYACLSQYDPLSGTCVSSSGTPNVSCIPNIANYATNYAISDSMFSDQTPSWAGHMVFGSASTERFVGNNPQPYPGITTGPGWGCDSGKTEDWTNPDGTQVQVPSCVPSDATSGNLGPLWTSWTGTKAYYEPTIFDRLDSAGVSWKIYGGNGTGSGGGYGWTICPTFEECLGGPQSSKLVTSVNPSTGAFAAGPLANDISNGTLPAVSFVTPTTKFSSHQGNAMSAGDNWVGTVVGAIQANPSLWSTTAIFVTFDDCGCFYDPVNPLQYDPEWGPRVPLIIISPYAKAGYTDTTPAVFASLLAYVEQTFFLAPLNPCGGVDSWDSFCTDDLRSPPGVNGGVTYAFQNAFDYSQTPLKTTTTVRTPLTPAQRTYLRNHPNTGDEAS
jgi:hypothetical protein